MSDFSNEKIEQHLDRAVSELVPDDLEKILNAKVSKANGREWYLQKKKKKTALLSVMAACLAIFLMSGVFLNFHSDAAVYMDVNPSVTLEVNCFDKVLAAKASNPDGDAVLADMNLRNTDLNVAVNAVLGSMVKNGFITENKGTVLLSVEGSGAKRTEKLQAKVTENVESSMEQLVSSSSVLTQNIPSDENLKKLAEQYGVTPGKIMLMQKLTEADATLKMEDYVNMPMGELMKVLKQQNVDVRDFAQYSGSVLFEDIDMDDDYEDIMEDLLEGPDNDADDPDDDTDDADGPDDDTDDADDPDDDTDDHD